VAVAADDEEVEEVAAVAALVGRAGNVRAREKEQYCAENRRHW
jgi:hypothetical protein